MLFAVALIPKIRNMVLELEEALSLVTLTKMTDPTLRLVIK
jgi:hypothetical protein